MEQMRRRSPRLPAFTYGAGWYFVTICTENREKCLAMIAPFVGADDSVRPCATSEMFEYKLMPLGEMVKECLERLEDRDGGVMVDEYVIMPNHIHVVIRLNEGTGGQSRPPLQRLIQRAKKTLAKIVLRSCHSLPGGLYPHLRIHQQQPGQMGGRRILLRRIRRTKHAEKCQVRALREVRQGI